MDLNRNLRRAVLALTLATMAACASPTSSDDVASDDIIAGKAATAYPEAVLVNMLQGGQIVAACSGSIIAPKVVLTAGHCVYHWSEWQVIAPYADQQTASSTQGTTYDWKVAGEAVDPSKHDVGLVFLTSPIKLSSYPKIAEKPLAGGAHLLNIGRIQDGALSDSQLFVSKSIAIELGTSSGFPYDYSAKDEIESGDSGGPDVVAGAAPHTIVAVNSGASESTEVLARVDLVASWIADQIAAHGGGGAPTPAKPPAPAKPPSPAKPPKPSTPTPALPPVTPVQCAHDPCDAGAHLDATCDPCVAEVCAADDYCCTKRWDAQCASEVPLFCAATCATSSPATSTCGDLTAAGACDGDVLTWCDGDVQTIDCQSLGLTCAQDPGDGSYDCL